MLDILYIHIIGHYTLLGFIICHYILLGSLYFNLSHYWYYISVYIIIALSTHLIYLMQLLLLAQPIRIYTTLLSVSHDRPI